MELMYSQISWVREDAARAHDSEITALAMRKRTGSNSDDIFEVKHVVLTRNPWFPVLARRIARGESYIAPNHVGPVIHHQQLATAIWLRAGARSDAEIPRRYILASCRRVLTLRKNIVEKVHHLKSELSAAQADQLELLLSVDRSAQVLMDKTLGSASIINSSNIALLVEEMKKAQIAEHVAVSEVQLQQATAEFRSRERGAMRKAKADRESLEAEIKKLKNSAYKADAETQIANKQLDGVWRGILNKANFVNRRYRRLVMLGAITIFVITSAFSYFGNIDNKIVSYGCFMLAVMLGGLFQFSNWFKRYFIDRVFEKHDFRSLKRFAAESGLDDENISDALSYSNGVFGFRENGSDR
jgi:hypothetical protein